MNYLKTALSDDCNSRPISPTSTVVRSSEQVSCDLSGESVILRLKDGVYFGLDPVGTRIWNLIEEPKKVDEILGAILANYDVEPGRGEHDLLALLEDLSANGLIEVGNEAVS